jgi:hypothetical protein
MSPLRTKRGYVANAGSLTEPCDEHSPAEMRVSRLAPMGTAHCMDESISSDPIETLLTGLAFPIQRDAIVQAARSKKLERDVLARIENLPEAEYSNAGQVRQSFANLTPDSTRSDEAQR